MRVCVCVCVMEVSAKGSLVSLQGNELDGAFSVCVTDGLNVWVGV